MDIMLHRFLQEKEDEILRRTKGNQEMHTLFVKEKAYEDARKKCEALKISPVGRSPPEFNLGYFYKT